MFLRLLSGAAADLRAVYKARVDAGHLRHDERQFRLIKVLNKLSTYVCEYTPPPSSRPPLPVVGAPTTPVPESPPVAAEPSSQPPETPPPPPPPPPPRLKGMYIYGQVGVGKTMAMDVFYTHCPLASKRRVHFHKFMLEIHQRIHAYKQRLLLQYGREVHINLSSERDAIAAVAHDVADECRLLCFDEFQVTDICDAMMLAKFFGVLWERGTVLVATSNRPPTDLYKDGLNRSYFLPFIDRLQEECVVWDMGTGEDYRQVPIPSRVCILCDGIFTPAAPTPHRVATPWTTCTTRLPPRRTTTGSSATFSARQTPTGHGTWTCR